MHPSHIMHPSYINQMTHTQSVGTENFCIYKVKLKHSYCSVEMQGKVKIILVGGKQELQSQAYMYELHLE